MSVPSKTNGVPRQYQRPARNEVAGCGMCIGYAIMGALFLSGLALYFFFVIRAGQWPPPGMPHIPDGLWLSTLLLLISSGTLHWALSSAKADNTGQLKVAMALTLGLGLGFLILQCINWAQLWHALGQVDPALLKPAPYVDPEIKGPPIGVWSMPFAFLFYLLTGLHAAHVIGGVIWLGLGTAASFRGYYQPNKLSGMRAMAQYWHFLDVVWIVLFTVLLTTS